MSSASQPVVSNFIRSIIDADLASDKHTVCHWKGVASYYDVVVGGQVNKDAAWYYPETEEAAQNIRGYIAFWHGVRVED